MDFIPDEFFDCLDVLHAVDDEEAFWEGACEDEVAVADAFVEFDIFLFHAVGEVACAVADASHADFCGDVDDDGEVGHEGADSEGIDVLDGIAGHAPCSALVDSGGVEKAVAQDDSAIGKGWDEKFPYELCSTGRK